MQVASQPWLGSLDRSLTRCFPLKISPTNGEDGAASMVVCSASEGRKHTSASRAVDEGSGVAMRCGKAAHVSRACTKAAPADSRDPKNGSMGEGIAASCAARPSEEPEA